MSAHTPGSWKMQRQHEAVNADILILGPSDYLGCRKIIATIDYEEDAEANARLIAAAPETAAERDKLKAINAELVEAFQSLLNEIDSRGYHNDFTAQRATIAKAKGE